MLSFSPPLLFDSSTNFPCFWIEECNEPGILSRKVITNFSILVWNRDASSTKTIIGRSFLSYVRISFTNFILFGMTRCYKKPTKKLLCFFRRKSTYKKVFGFLFPISNPLLDRLCQLTELFEIQQISDEIQRATAEKESVEATVQSTIQFRNGFTFFFFFLKKNIAKNNNEKKKKMKPYFTTKEHYQ